MTFKLLPGLTLAALILAGLSWTGSAGAAPKPVKDVVLFRADLSVVPGSYLQHVTNSDAQDETWDTYGLAAGPRLALNLGYAPSRLIRIGVQGTAAFSMSFADQQGIPSVELDGWRRWTVGPTVGFRFGPKVPLELEIGLAFSHIGNLGSQQEQEGGGSVGYSFSTEQFGTTTTALLLWRPGGANDIIALHAGIESTWGLSTTTPGDGSTTSNSAFLNSLVLGISFGL